MSSDPPRARCAFIIVGWSGPEVLEGTVGALLPALPPGDRVLVVDNKRRPETRAWVESKRDARLAYIDPGGNRGFAGAANAGIRAADRGASDWLVVMSDDALLEPSFRGALDELRGDASVGVLGPVSRRLEDKTPYFLSRRIDYFRIITRDMSPPPGRLAPTDYVEGRCLALRARLFDTVGPFDEAFFIWLEDVDFCVRAARRGFGVFIDTTSSVFDSEKTGAPSRFKTYLNARNRVYFALKHATAVQACCAVFRIAAVDAPRALGSPKPGGGRDFAAGPDLLAAVLDGIKLRLRPPANPRAAAFARFEQAE